jgi:hypothetical protein
VTPLYVNGRFLTQALTGVQRFAGEIARALPRPYTLLAPPSAPDTSDLPLRRVGRRGGHAWEQFELPRHAAGGILLSLGNTAPLALRRQVVVIHDAAAFAVPEDYSWRFRTLYRGLQRALVGRGATIATVSHFARTQITRHLGIPPERIAVVGEGAEHILRPAPDRTILARLGLSRPFVLSVGSLAPHKNLAALTATAAMLAARGHDLVLTGELDPRVFAAPATLPAKPAASPTPSCAPSTKPPPASSSPPATRASACRRWKPWPASARWSPPAPGRCPKPAPTPRSSPIPPTPPTSQPLWPESSTTPTSPRPCASPAASAQPA